MFFFKKKDKVTEVSASEDADFCKNLLADYMRDSDPNKYGGIGLEDLALKLGIDLNGI